MQSKSAFEKATDPTVITDPPVVLASEQFEIYNDTDINEVLDMIVKQLINRIEIYDGIGSG